MEQRTEQADLLEYSRILWARRWLIVSVTGVAVIGVLLYCLATTKTYQATAKLLISPALPATLLQANAPAANTGVVDVPTNIQVIESSTVANMVAKEIGSSPSVSATQIGLTDVVEVSATSTDPKLAQRAANAYVTSYLQFERQMTSSALSKGVAALQQRLASIQTAIGSVTQEVSGVNASQPGVEAELAAVQSALQVEESTLENQLASYSALLSNQSIESGQLITAAPLPTKPSSPKTVEYTLLALIGGLIVGVGVALIVQAVSESSQSRRRAGVRGNGSDHYGGGGRHSAGVAVVHPSPVSTAPSDDTLQVTLAGPEAGH